MTVTLRRLLLLAFSGADDDCSYYKDQRKGDPESHALSHVKILLENNGRDSRQHLFLHHQLT